MIIIGMLMIFLEPERIMYNYSDFARNIRVFTDISVMKIEKRLLLQLLHVY